ncbi:MAG: SpoIID/LytB domain-containing protein [Blastochloris sp.]|nr:SpoIID/LytB domain-containing protein [Blastochloris sp.]
MRRYTLPLWLGSLYLWGIYLGVVQAQNEFTIPEEMTVAMFRLDEEDASPHPSGELCALGSTVFGCSDYIGNPDRAYPYDANPVTIPIETDYLLDVVTVEMNPNLFDPTAVEAQFIAARTFGYFQIEQRRRDATLNPINNSTEFQAFIPYRFERRTAYFPPDPGDPCGSENIIPGSPADILCQAASRTFGSYMTSNTAGFGGDFPVFAAFSADVIERTTDFPGSGASHLISVANPISRAGLDPAACSAVNLGNPYGMMQQGAARWARGDQCAERGEGTIPWSVRWREPVRILTHYYTGIHVRDSTKTIVTPDNRWNPLAMTWETSGRNPPTMTEGRSYPLTIQIQNTGIDDWTCFSDRTFSLRYSWLRSSEEQRSNTIIETCNLLKGAERSFDLTIDTNDIPGDWGPGIYTLRFDMYIDTDGPLARFRDERWPTYDVRVQVVPENGGNGRTGTIYLPLIQRGTAVLQKHVP